MSTFNVPGLALTNKRSSPDDALSASLDGRQNKKLDNKTTPRLSSNESTLPNTSQECMDLPKTSFSTGPAAGHAPVPTGNLNSYQRSFLSKYGTLPAAEPSGGIKWNKVAAFVPSDATGSGPTSASSSSSSSSSNPETNHANPTNKPPQTLVEAAAASVLKRDALRASRPAPVKNPALGGGKWTKSEDAQLCEAVKAVGPKNWRRISAEFLHGRRSDVQCLHRWQKVLRPGLVKGPWTGVEDAVIIKSISEGLTKWSEIAERIPGRIGKQCRERWFNHLDPRIKKGPWNEEEDRILIEAQAKLGNRWCEIAKMLPGRSENNVKNRWNSAMRRRYQAKKANEDGSMNPPSPAKRRNRKKSDKKKREKKEKKPRKKKAIDRSGPAPIQVGKYGGRGSGSSSSSSKTTSDFTNPEPWSSPFGFGAFNHHVNPNSNHSSNHNNGYKTSGTQGVPTPATTLSPVSRAYTQRANEQQKAQNRSSLTERERQLMHQAFLAGAAVTRNGAAAPRRQDHGRGLPPTLSQDAKDGVQWNFSGTGSMNMSGISGISGISGGISGGSVDIPSIAAFSALGGDGMVHTDIDRRSANTSMNGGSARRVGQGNRKRVPSFDGGGPTNNNNNNNNNAMEISWGLGSVGNDGDVEMLNSAEMADMSLSMLGLSMDGSSNGGGGASTSKIPAITTALQHSKVRSMSPTAAKLAEISGEFKLGRISIEEKERRKEEVLSGVNGRRK